MSGPSIQCMPPHISHTSISQKMRSKQYALSMKFGSPKLRDLLRQVS